VSDPGPAARWITVAAFRQEERARLLAGRLRAEGIEARVYPEWQGGYYGESVHVPSQVLVLEHRAVEARLLVESLERA
jgi:hypothetical protein